MAFVDADYVDSCFVEGSAMRQALFKVAGAYQSTHFDRTASQATAYVRARLQEAGYTAPDDTALAALSAHDQELLKSATFEVFRALAYKRNGLTLPEELPDFRWLAEKLATGDVDLEGIAPSATEGIGGIYSSETDEDVEGNRAPVFGRRE